MCSKQEPFHALLPFLRHVVAFNDGICPLTIPVVKGHCDHEALPHAFNIGVFKYGKSNPTTIKHIYNESENSKVVTLLLTAIIGGIFHNSVSDWHGEYGVGMESMVTRTGLRYTQDYLKLGICSLIKPAAMEKLMSFRA